MMHLFNNTLLHGGSYKIVRFISSGGFGCTYEAEHILMKKRVAIKEFFVKDFCNRDEETARVTVATQSKKILVEKLRKKFIEEGQALSQLHHPGIVRVSDVFEENDTAYFVMDYIEGKSLGELIHERGTLPENEALRYILEVADALDYVHAHHRLHLDIKPGNIMLEPDGKGKNHVVLIDFGASKHYDEETEEQTSTLLGINTKGYAPMEQMSQNFTTFSAATDIYALGATFYKLLTGVTPPNSLSLISEEEKLLPLPQVISVPVRNAVAAAMQLKRKDRPQTIAEFVELFQDNTRYTDCISETVIDENVVDVSTEVAGDTCDIEEQHTFFWAHPYFKVLCALLLGGIFSYFIFHEPEKKELPIDNNDNSHVDNLENNTIQVQQAVIPENNPVVESPLQSQEVQLPLKKVVTENKRTVSKSASSATQAEESAIRTAAPDDGDGWGINIEDLKDDADEPLVVDNALVEDPACYPGGETALLQFISKNLVYPSVAMENETQGTVLIRFRVEKDGFIGKVVVKKGVSPECDQAAIDVVKKLKRFVPAKEKGHPVPVWFTLPIRFAIV